MPKVPGKSRLVILDKAKLMCYRQAVPRAVTFPGRREGGPVSFTDLGLLKQVTDSESFDFDPEQHSCRDTVDSGRKPGGGDRIQQGPRDAQR